MLLFDRIGCARLTLTRTNNATIEVIIEGRGFNNSLAGSQNCPNSNDGSFLEPVKTWAEIYLKGGTFVLLSSDDAPILILPSSNGSLPKHDGRVSVDSHGRLRCAGHVSV